MAEDLTSPIFAGRYRFEPVDDDWDRGNSGYTHLVFDMQRNRLGVIKRAESISAQAVNGLNNEAEALKALRGLGVAEVYDVGEANHGSKKYTYLVNEYIEGIRVEKSLTSLTLTERAEILTQVFGLLARAHRRGIVNGDVDLKHLFWRRDKKELVMIDWGNAKLGVDANKETEFAYDLARSAEIIYSLVTITGELPVTGPLSLPNDSELIPALRPLPKEYYKLCEWAPRVPSEGAKAPYTALELFEISKNWRTEVNGSKSGRVSKPKRGRAWLVLASLLLVGVCAFMAYRFFPNLPFIAATSSVTPSLMATESQTQPTASPDNSTPTETPSPTATLTKSPTATKTLTPTQAPVITPSPEIYSDTPPSLVFFEGTDKEIVDSKCWTNAALPSSELEQKEGFTQRTESPKYWDFRTLNERPVDEMVQTDFSQCIDVQDVKAFGLNIDFLQLDPGREFGFFLEDVDGNRREYTIWLDNKDNVDRMYLRVRENTSVPVDYERLPPDNLDIPPGYIIPFYRFAIQIFFEIDNNNLDILYLREGNFGKPVNIENLVPNEKNRIDDAVFPTLGNIQKIGLIGYGGTTQTLIWPLAFFGN